MLKSVSHQEDDKVVPPICDLTRVGQKLMEPAPEGKGWTAEQVFEAETWYRRYLLLCKKYPKHQSVPNYPIDQFWHQHILDTMAYGEDCHKYFGYFLHHYPYFGLNGVEDAKNRDDAFDVTNELYRAEFGEDCTSMLMFRSLENSGCSDTGCEGGGAGCDVGKSITVGGTCTSGQAIAEPKPFCRAGKAGPCWEGDYAPVASGCGGAGSGTGCGQRCGRNVT